MNPWQEALEETAGHPLYWWAPGGVSGDSWGLAEDAAALPLRRLNRLFAEAAATLPPDGALWLGMADPFALETPDGLPFPGARVGPTRYRPLPHWLELAEHHHLRLAGVRTMSVAEQPALVLELRPASPKRCWPTDGVGASWPTDGVGASQAKYQGSYQAFDKLEEPAIYLDLLYAAARLAPPAQGHILSLGVGDAWEWQALLEASVAPERQESWTFYGLDTSPAALDRARHRFPDAERFLLFQHPAEEAAGLGLPPLDLLLCLNTLQSRTVDREQVLRQLNGLLRPVCGVLFALPACHIDGRGLVQRATTRNNSREDQAVVLKDALYLSRFLRRHGFQQVEVFGRAYLWVMGRRR